MGRYYSMQNGNLYIYVTGDDSMLDLKLFPSELNLFESESAWRAHDRVAIVNDVEAVLLDRAEVILNLNGFRRRDIEEELLESYYAQGDETVLGGEVPPEIIGPPSPRMEPEQGPVVEDVIMPAVAMPEVLEPEGAAVTTPPQEITPRMTEPQPEVPPMAEAPLVPRATDERELIRHIMRYIRSRGFHYPPRLVKNYYISLKTKSLVILMGYSGTGKTALTRLMAEAVSDDVEEQYLRVSVQPDWLDDKGLVGFYDPPTGKYVSTPFLDLLLKAADDPDKPYFLCLDEMNLSRVEHYFSRLLSAMESIDREVHLHGVRGGVETEDGRLVPPKVRMPENLFISGTIDIDDSPVSLRPKLLHHANVIEFFEVDLSEHPRKREYSKRLALDMETLNRFKGTPQPSEEARVVETLIEVDERTIKRGFPVSYRVRQEVLDYVVNSRDIYSRDEEENLKTALDVQIKQRVLSKIAGTESVRPLLEDLQQYFKGSLPLSAEKVKRMLERLEEFGFTSFYI